MKAFKLTLTKKHRRQAGDYVDNENCLCAVALKELFPTKKVSVGIYTCRIGEQSFWMSLAGGNKIQKAYQRKQKFPFAIILKPAL